MQNHYHKLGISEDASPEEIKQAFKKLAVKYHPDKNPGDHTAEERFKGVNEAYQVLSNPYEKARYDLKLKYGGATYEEDLGHYRAPNYRPRNYAEPTIDYRQNWIATAYAFGFTLVVAMIIMTGVWISNFIKDQELKELLSQRREQFQWAKTLHTLGEFGETLAVLNELGGFHATEMDMKTYKLAVIEEVVTKGEVAFDARNFQEAIFFFRVLESHAPKEIVTLKEKLAIAYKEANQPMESIKVFKELLTIGYRHISTYVQLAEIHRDQLNDHEMAKHYFEIASSFAIEYYKGAYGNAYPIMLKGSFLPPVHYHLYTGLADSYLNTGDLEMAINATSWNLEMWPDSTANYVIAAKAFEALGQITSACEFYQAASQVDRTMEVPFLCY